jgi:hypothetical protein
LWFLAACAVEPPPESPVSLPPPPPAPPRVHVQRVAPRPQPPAAGVTTDAERPSQAASGPVWRVAHDGVVGCADSAALDVLRRSADGAPRLLAEARASGGCRTTFRVNEWALLDTDAGLVRLRLINGVPLTLWFQRGDVVAP